MIHPRSCNAKPNFYPRSPCGERHTWARGSRVTYVISIHALLAESDQDKFSIPSDNKCHFYPRSPCGERQQDKHHPHHERGFLSTLSLRRATIDTSKDISKTVNFYPRSPCGERRFLERSFCHESKISIHALLAESDDCSYGALAGATISIHALLAESDWIDGLRA